MTLEFPCTSCSKLLRVPESVAGKKCKCPECGFIQVASVPEPVELVEGIQIETPCPKCGSVLLSDPSLEGTRGLCKACHTIFTISFRGGQDDARIEAGTFPFECPDCKFMFEGKPEMEGRKGKCTECGKVFVIEPKAKANLKKRKPVVKANPLLVPNSNPPPSSPTTPSQSTSLIPVKPALTAVPTVKIPSAVARPVVVQTVEVVSPRTPPASTNNFGVATPTHVPQSPNNPFGDFSANDWHAIGMEASPYGNAYSPSSYGTVAGTARLQIGTGALISECFKMAYDRIFSSSGYMLLASILLSFTGLIVMFVWFVITYALVQMGMRDPVAHAVLMCVFAVLAFVSTFIFLPSLWNIPFLAVRGKRLTMECLTEQSGLCFSIFALHLLVALAYLPAGLVMFLSIATGVVSNNGLRRHVEPNLGLMFVAGVIGIVISIFVVLPMMLVPNGLLEDRPFDEALRRSFRVAYSQLGNYLVLLLVTTTIHVVLSICTAGIGSIFTSTFFFLVQAAFYKIVSSRLK